MLISASCKPAYALESIDSQQNEVIEHHATNENSPSTVNRAAVTENCQRWVVRVLTRLAEVGVIEDESVALAENILEPMN